MYTTKNFKTKKELKEAVARGEKVTYYQPGPFGGSEPLNGTIYCEGPWEYHKWYAQCECKDGYIVKVK
jgi:hypothetical protein